MGLRIPLVINGLFNAFFLLLETFCRGIQKFISLLTLMIKDSDDELKLLHSKWGSTSQSVFSSCSDIVSLVSSSS